jgi:hypothetical protein
MDTAWVCRQIERKNLIRISKTQIIGKEETTISGNQFFRPPPTNPT